MYESGEDELLPDQWYMIIVDSDSKVQGEKWSMTVETGLVPILNKKR